MDIAFLEFTRYNKLMRGVGM